MVTPIPTTAYDLAQRFIGTKEVAGGVNNPQIMAMLKLDNSWPDGDEVAWCSAFVNYIAWLLRLPRSKDLAARSWLTIGTPIPLNSAEPGFDVVIMKRGGGNQPGPEVLKADGHVAFFGGFTGSTSIPVNQSTALLLLGGNQGNQVSITGFNPDNVLGVRRLKLN